MLVEKAMKEIVMRVSRFFILVLASSFLAACQQEAAQLPSSSQANIQQINSQGNAKKETVESGKPVAESMIEVVPTERTAAEKTMVTDQEEALKTSNSRADEVVAKVESRKSKPVEPSKEMKVMDTVKTPVKPKMATTVPAILEAEAGNPLQGAKIAKKCGACHTFDQGGKTKSARI